MADNIATINDEALVKDFIASSPEVTKGNIQEGEGEDITAQEINNSAKPKNSSLEFEIDEDKAQRDADVVGRSINTGLSNFTGTALNDDQSAIVSAFAREMFEVMQSSGMPRMFRIAILGVSASLALLPVFLQIKGKKEE